MIELFLYLTLSIFGISSLICCTRKGYGFTPIFFSMYFIFILIIPAMFHVDRNIFPFYGMSYSIGHQFYAVILLLIFSIFFWIGFFIKKNKKILEKCNDINLDKRRFFLIIFFCLIFLIGSILYYGVDTFMVRRSEFNSDVFGENSSIKSLITTFLRSLSFGVFFYLVIFKKYLKGVFWWGYFFSALIIFFVVNYPLALPRFIFFGYLICFFLFYFNPSFKNKSLLFLVFGLGITTLFPLTSHLTRGEGDFNLNIAEYYASSGDFDSFQSIINCIIYVEKNGFELGNQMLSSVLGFIPRSVWTGKGDPTGAITAAAAGYEYVNISSPLPAEFFIDFGFLGLIVFSFLFGYFLRYLDQNMLFNKKFSFIFLISLCLTSLIVIISRGALLAIINVVYSEIFIFAILYLLCIYKFKIKF